MQILLANFRASYSRSDRRRQLQFRLRRRRLLLLLLRPARVERAAAAAEAALHKLMQVDAVGDEELAKLARRTKEEDVRACVCVYYVLDRKPPARRRRRPRRRQCSSGSSSSRRVCGRRSRSNLCPPFMQ